MPPNGPLYGCCPNCNKRFPHAAGPGRRKTYCTPACSKRAERARKGLPDRTTPDRKPLGRPIAEDLQPLAARLVQGEYQGSVLDQQLEVVRAIRKQLDYYEAAAVQDARDRGQKWAEVAQAAQTSPRTARRQWPEHEVLRRLNARTAPPQPAPAVRSVDGTGEQQPKSTFIPHQRYDPGYRSGPRPAADGAPGAASATGPPPAPPTPGMKFASALSQLHRTSGKTVRAIAQESGVSSSYVSRVLAGERRPSWNVAEQLATACNGNPAEIRALWEATRGLAPAPRQPTPADAADTLRAALRGLYLSAAQPDPAFLTARTTLTGHDIDTLLHGRGVPDWPTVGRFVISLQGQPADIRPLWDAAHHMPCPTRHAPGPHQTTLGPPAGSFG